MASLADEIKRRKVAEEWLPTDTSDDRKSDSWIHWPTVLEAGEPAPTPYVKTEEAPAPEKLDQVERAELVKLPPEPAPATLPQVERGELVKPPAPDEDYVVDKETGKMIPRAPLVDPDPDVNYLKGEALRAQMAAEQPEEPAGAAQLGQVDVTGQVPVRRAELIDPDPDLLYTDEAARAQLIPTPPAVKPALPVTQPSGEAPADLAQVERGQLVKVPPGTVPRAPLIPTPPAVQRADLTQPQTPPAVKPAIPIATNPDGSDFPSRVQAVGNNDPAAFIVHHTSGRGTVDGVVSTLKERGLGVQYVMDRVGNIFQTGGPGAQNIRTGWGKGEGLSNRNVVGMEIIANDDKDVTPAQAQSFARFIAARYPNTPLYGHGEVNPGHKEADEGQTAKAAALAYREGGGAEAKGPAWQSWATVDKEGKEVAPAPGQVPKAVSVEPGKVVVQKTGFYEDEKPENWATGKATTFGYNDPLDPGVGSKSLGNLSTNNQVLYGVAVPLDVLRSQLGDPRNWRKARVDLVDTTTGQRLRLPIVDVGPHPDQVANGVVVDMTAATDKYFNNQGGAHQFKVNIVPGAGADIENNPQAFWDEQAAIRAGIDTGAKGRPKQKPASAYWQTWEALDPKIQAIANESAATKRQVQQNTITALPEAQSNNVIGLYKRLDKPVENVSDAMRKQVQANLKPQIVAQMREKYPELKSDDEAWNKAQSDTGIVEFGQEFGSKLMGYIQQIETVTRKAGAGTDRFAVDRFLGTVLPNGSDAEKHDLLAKLYTMSPDRRAAEIESRLGPGYVEPGNPNKDPQFLSEAMTRLADPNFQQRKADELTKLQAEMHRNLSDDPRLKGTWAEKVVNNAAQLVTTIPQFATPAMWPLALAQVNDQMREAAKAEHPEWDEKTLTDNAARATLTTFFGQLAANKLITMGIGPLIGAGVSPAKRIIAQALAAAGGGPAIAAGTKAATNIATGEPVGKGVGEAAESGLIQGVLGGLPHVGGEIVHGLVRRTEEPVRPPVAGERGAPIQGAEEKRLEQPPAPPLPALSRIEGMNVPDYVKDTLRQDFGLAQKLGIVEKIEQLAADRHTAQQTALALKIPGDRSEQNRLIRSVRAVLGIPSMDDTSAFAQWLSDRRKPGSEGPPPVAGQPPPPAVPVTKEDVHRRAYELYDERTKNGQPGTALDDWTRAQQELSQAKEPTPVTQGESEPWVSAIANRFTAERVARGQLGDIIPGEGYSKEELLAKGLQMGPEQINQHVSDLMNNRGGDPKLQAGAVRAEEARLSQRSNAASRALEADPGNKELRIEANNAFDDLTDFHNGPVARLKSNWHAQGLTLQGEVPVDMTTFNGMREKFLRDVGNPPPANMEPVLRKVAQRVRDSVTADNQALANLGAEIERQTARARLPTAEEVRIRIMERMKVDPCIS